MRGAYSLAPERACTSAPVGHGWLRPARTHARVTPVTDDAQGTADVAHSCRSTSGYERSGVLGSCLWSTHQRLLRVLCSAQRAAAASAGGARSAGAEREGAGRADRADPHAEGADGHARALPGGAWRLSARSRPRCTLRSPIGCCGRPVCAEAGRTSSSCCCGAGGGDGVVSCGLGACCCCSRARDGARRSAGALARRRCRSCRCCCRSRRQHASPRRCGWSGAERRAQR